MPPDHDPSWPDIGLFEAMSTARAIRRYRTDPVPDDVLSRCIEAATWAPSGSNRQGWRFVVLRSPEARAVIAPAFQAGWRAKARGDGFDAPPEGDTSPRARFTRSMATFVERIEDVPVFVLFCLQRRDRAPHLTDGASIYPALQNFLLAARAHGLGAVVTGWFVMAEPKLRELVGIPDDWLLAALIPVGYPEGRHGPLKRKPITEVAYAERWDNPLPT